MIRKAPTEPTNFTAPEPFKVAEVLETESIPVTDMDLVFVGPLTYTITLEPGDVMTDQYGDGSVWLITFHKTGEVVTVTKANLLYTAQRTRTLIRAKKKVHVA